MWRVWCWTDERLFRRLPDVCLCGCNREYGGTDRQALLREGDAPQSFRAQQFGRVRASDYTIAQVDPRYILPACQRAPPPPCPSQHNTWMRPETRGELL